MRLSILITLAMLITMIHGFNRMPLALDVNGVDDQHGIQQRQSVSGSASVESVRSSRRKRDLGMVSSAEFNRKKRDLGGSESSSVSVSE